MKTTTVGSTSRTPSTTTRTTTKTTTGSTTRSSTTRISVSTTPAKTTTASKSSTTMTVTTKVTPKTTTITTPTTPGCLPLTCQWSQWLDTNYPDSVTTKGGGEFESIAAMWKSGNITCEKPADIECRAKEYKDVPLADLGQNVTCDVSVGLKCYNTKNNFPPCYNYEIRVKCCRGNENCATTKPSSTTKEKTTTATTGSTTRRSTTYPVSTTMKTTTVGSTSRTPSTTTRTTTKTTTGSTTRSSTTRISVSTTPAKTTTASKSSTTMTVTTKVTPKTTTITTPTTPGCLPLTCQWSQWLDTNYPDSVTTKGGGEFESIAAMWKSGNITCEKPADIECRAKEYKDVPLADLGQNVTCDVSVGLKCYNTKNNFPPCYNYEIRVKCCRGNENCATTKPSSTTKEKTTTATTGSTTRRSTTYPVSTTMKTTTVGSTSRTPSTTTRTTTKTTTGSTTRSSTTRISVSTTPAKTTTASKSSTTMTVTTKVTPKTTTITTPTTPGCLPLTCQWSQWLDTNYPDSVTTKGGGEFESIAAMWKSGNITCEKPADIECRAKAYKDVPLADLGQNVTCDVSIGLKCYNTKNNFPPCYNYEIRVKCCRGNENCATTKPSSTTTGKTTTATTGSTTRRSTTYPVSTTMKTTTVGSTSRTPSTTTRTTTKTTTGSTTRSSTTRISVSTTPAKTTTASKSSTTMTVTTKVTPKTTTITTPTTPGCLPLTCQWSQWLDTNYPDSVTTKGGGEFESIAAMWKSGNITCEKPADIECRAKEYKDVPLADLGQNVTCDVSVGLKCYNTKNNFPPCYNYEIRVKCCRGNENCATTKPSSTTKEKTTTATTGSTTRRSTTYPVSTTMKTTTVGSTSRTPSTTTRTTTKTTTGSTTRSSTTRISVSTTPAKTTTASKSSTTMTVTTKVTPKTTTITTPTTPGCLPLTCQWSQWLDTNYPDSVTTKGGGEFESIAAMWKSGNITCEKPADIECRAKEYKDVPLADLGQNVTCDVSVGLKCYNTKNNFPPCYNYEIRVKCCRGNENCATTKPSSTTKEKTTTATTGSTTRRSTTYPVSTTMKTTTVGSTSRTPSTTTRTTTKTTTGSTTRSSTTRISVSTTPAKTTTASKSSTTMTVTTKVTPKTTTITTPTTPGCLPLTCQWSQWLDTNYPDSVTTKGGGEFESIAAMWKSGNITCEKPADIECRAKEYKDVPLADLGQNVTCDISVGLKCYNTKNNFPPCYNYEIRVKCCRGNENCATTKPSSTTKEKTTTATTGSTTRRSTTYPVSTTMKTTTVGSTSRTPSTTTRTTTKTTTGSTTRSSTTRISVSTTPAKTTTASKSSTTMTVTTKVTPKTTTITTPTTPGCLPLTCQWSQWLDTNYPDSVTTKGGGEFESIAAMWKSGNITCEKPADIECRAKEYKDVPLADLGQNVTCDVSVGLKCYNTKNNFPPCYNYEIRVKCCRGNENCATTKPSSTTKEKTTTATTGSTTRRSTTYPVSTTMKTTTVGSTSRTPSTTTRTTTKTTTGSTTRSSTTRISVSTTPAKTTTASKSSTTMTVTTKVTPKTTTITTPTTPGCLPLTCQWSQWLDTNYPDSVTTKGGGEFESIAAMWKSGNITCEKPADIECRAKEYKDVPLADLGQNVTCDVSVGLKCYNTKNNFPPCYNYEIRVKCCRGNENCATTKPSSTTKEKTTTATTGSTTRRSTTYPVSTTMKTTTVGSTSRTPSTTTRTTTKTTTGSTTRSSTTRISVSTTPAKTTTASKSSTTMTVTTKVTPKTTTITTPTTPGCLPLTCQWSQWLDTNYPDSVTTKGGGEFESIAAMWKSGNITCEKPADIECRAKEYKDVPLADLGQNVTCDVSVGLKCYNTKNNFPPCYNYEIRVKCCRGNENCATTKPSSTTTGKTTTATTGSTSRRSTTYPVSTTMKTTTVGSTSRTPSTTTRTTTKTTTGSTTRSSTTRISVSTTPAKTTTASKSSTTMTVTTKVTPKTTTITTPTTPGCSPLTCQWSQWLDTNYPDSVTTKGGGEFESIAAMWKSGNITCEKPADIECRAKEYKDVPLADLGQNVTCDVSVGLKCYNTKNNFPPCYNYEIRVKCCRGNENCATTKPSSTTKEKTTTATTGSTTRRSTTYPVSTTMKTTTVGSTSRTPSTTTRTTTKTTTGSTTRSSTTRISVSTTPAKTTTASKSSTTMTVTTKVTPKTTTITTPTTPGCLPLTCQWSQWLDTNYPDSVTTKGGGEFESIAAMWKSGNITCEKPADIECRAKEYKDVPLADLGQNVTCDVSVGLKCYNTKNNFPPCYNYEIRVKCCRGNENCATTKPSSTTKEKTTTATTGSTTRRSTTYPVSTTMKTTTVGSTSRTPSTTTRTTTKTTTGSTTRSSTTRISVSTTPAKTTTASKSSTTMTVTTKVTPKTTTITTPTTPGCSPLTCQWSQWLDTNYPDSVTTKGGGEFESIAAMWKSGNITCEKPADIECRAKEYKDVPLADLGQNVTCDVSVGLKCYNTKNNFPPCYNYEIRVKCCRGNENCATTKPSSTTKEKTTTATTGSTTRRSTTYPVSTTMKTTTVGSTSRTPSTTTRTTTKTTTGSTTRSSTTRISVSTTPAKTTTASKSSTTMTVTTKVTPKTTTITTPTTPGCLPLTCQWSQWLDTNYPDSVTTKGGGEFESIAAMWKSGNITCEKPADIECRAKEYKDVPLADLGQNVTCDVSVGLKCYNTKNNFPPCYNYEIRVKCCRGNENCATTKPSSTTKEKTTTATTGSTTRRSTTYPVSTTMKTTTVGSTSRTPSTTTRTTTKTTTGSTTRSSTTRISVSTTPAKTTTASKSSTTMTVTTKVTPKTTTITTPTTPGCLPLTCQWSQWLDTNYPDSVTTKGGGEFESIAAMWKSGNITCEKPADIECRAKEYKDVPLAGLGQNVTCDVSVGLKCYNTKNNFPPCYNYEIRVKCCKVNENCATTKPSSTTKEKTTTATTGSTTRRSTTYPVSTTMKTTTVGSTSRTPSTTTRTTTKTTTGSTTRSSTTRISVSTTPAKTTTASKSSTTMTVTTKVTPKTTTITTPTTPGCLPLTCQWSQWLDTNYPDSVTTKGGGEFESIAAMWKSGNITCEKPADIECRAKEYKDVPLADLGQNVTCDVSVGLKCYNTKNNFPPCYNYEIRVKCCRVNENCATTKPSSTTKGKTTTATTGSTTRRSTTYPVSTTMKTTTVGSTSRTPSTTTRTTTKTTTGSTTRSSTTRISVSTTPAKTTTASKGSTTMTVTTKVTPKTTTITTPTAPGCLPLTCQWSQWLDTNYPDSVTTKGGGEFESIAAMWKSGNITCEKPADIECRAKEYKDVPLADLGQNVTCDVSVGLKCYNTENNFPPCYNYEIRVKCCRGNENCATTKPSSTTTTGKTTTATTGSTTRRSTTYPVSTTMKTTTVGSTSRTPSTTTRTTTKTTTGSTTRSSTTRISVSTTPAKTTTASRPTQHSTTETTFNVITKPTTTNTPSPVICVCIYKTKEFSPGSLMYNETRGAGQCSSVYCGPACEIVITPQPCPSTTPPSPTPPTSAARSTSTPAITTSKPFMDCEYLDPPKKNGETWTEDCFVKTCVNGSGIITPVCKDLHPPKPVCDNPNTQPERIKDGCCLHYKCPCTCKGWGDAHYVTFDGQYYAFQGNCTYVLVQEIIKKYNFSVHIKNCNVDQGLACPESLTIYYKSYEINLIQTRNPTVNTVLVNNKEKNTAFSNDDFTITSTGIKMIVTIPAINAEINFAGRNFLVTLPSSLFQNNTEGQCGVCDNNKKNDCRLPNGQIGSCETMAGAWKVNDTRCPFIPPTVSPTSPPTPTAATKTTTPTTNAPCDPDICKVILSQVFKECRKLSPHELFYEACKYDVCRMGNSSGCYSLEAYASACADASVCVDWRNSTNGLCEYKCPSHKVYQACGSKVEKTCNSGYNDKFVNCASQVCQGLEEGCVCPKGTTQLNSVTDICTPFCGCEDSDGLARKPGDKWKMNCKDCECRAENMGPVCKPVQCPVLEPCNKAGYEIKRDGCCPECVRKPVCVFNNTEYLPGAKVPVDICKDCICGSSLDPKTGLKAIECSTVTCNTTCSQGFSYVSHPGQCCGTCVQQHCIYTGPNKTVYTIEVGKSFNPPNEKCAISYNCTKVNDAFTLVANKSTCPAFNPEYCINGTVTTTPDGCCKTCKIQNCRVQRNNTYLVVNNCTSAQSVEITSCYGSCDTSSIYSMAANSMMHQCSCCQELRIRSKQVEMNCPDQRQITYTYTYVEECGCQVTECKDKKR
ncbi:mucin-5AC-like [Pygocentrus nattereri]|nr:mucin-5AC-like [Pygocentrus nattereri]